MLQDGSLVSWVWFSLALVLFAIEAVRPGRFALWLGFAAVLVGIIASVARWPWPAELLALAAFAGLLVPAWRRYERTPQALPRFFSGYPQGMSVHGQIDEYARWEARFATPDYAFGKEPNYFLKSCQKLLPRRGQALAVADGEGRNGVWLTEQGLDVVSLDFS